MRNAVKRILLTLLLPAIVYAVFLVLSPSTFCKPSSLYIMFLQAIIPAVMGWGLCFMLASGLWDFSIGAVAVLVGIVAADVGLTYGLIPMLIAAVVLGTALDVITGAIYALLRVPSIVVTIAMALVYEAAGSLYKSGSGYTIPEGLTILGNPPYNFIIGAAAFAIAYLLFNHTGFGTHVRAIGSSERLAKNMGVKPMKVKFLCFAVCGFFIGISALLQLSYGGSMIPKSGLESMSMVFQPMMGVFIGLSLFKICNMIVGVFIGEFTMSIISTGMMSLGLPAALQNVVIGIFLLVFLIVSMNQDTAISAVRKRKKALFPS
jgi:ribose transport system permease protein